MRKRGVWPWLVVLGAAAAYAVPPSVDNIALMSATPVAGGLAVYRVVFDQPVSGVGIEDFALDAHNLVAEAIMSVSGAGALWDVTADTGRGCGVLCVDVADNDSIVNGLGEPLGGVGAGNGDADCTQQTVVNTLPPTLEVFAPAQSGVECTGAPVMLPDAAAADCLDGDLSAAIRIEGTVDAVAPGEYVVTYRVANSLGTEAAPEPRTFVVEDTQPPEVVLDGPNPLVLPCMTPYADPGFTAADACDPAPGVNADAGAVDHERAGSYIVTYTATDGYGHGVSVPRAVTVSGPCPPEAGALHDADTGADGAVSLSELLRVIQFYNVGSYHCAGGTEDGFDPGPGSRLCRSHRSDYNVRDWAISLSELLRCIQFYNSAGYIACSGSEDGYCPVA